MKIPVLSLAILAASSFHAMAQDGSIPITEPSAASCDHTPTYKYEVGFGIGSSYNTAYKSSNAYHITKPPQSLQPALNVVFAVNRKSWQFGLTSGYNKVETKFINNMSMAYSSVYSKSVEDEIWQSRSNHEVLSYSYIPLRLFANKRYYVSSTCLYGGISGGAVVPVTIMENRGRSKGPFFKGVVPEFINVTAGVQAGIIIPAGEHIGFNAELAATFLNMYGGYSTYAFPFTAGIRYRF